MTELALLTIAACLQLGAGADRITAGDLAGAWPALAMISPDTPLGLAPLPGARRMFRTGELRRIAARLRVEAAPAGELCVEHKMALLDPAEIEEAMLRAIPGARVEILEYSRRPVPPGRLEFEVEGLRRSGSGALWNGRVLYGAGRRFPIWARVKVTHTVHCVTAVAELKPGQPVEASQVAIVTVEAFPEPEVCAGSMGEVEGRLPRRRIPPGTPLRAGWLEPPKDVLRGEVVHVEALAGGARLESEGIAEASGSMGQSVPVRNPVSKKVFTARVEGRGKVSVGKGVQ